MSLGTGSCRVIRCVGRDAVCIWIGYDTIVLRCLLHLLVYLVMIMIMLIFCLIECLLVLTRRVLLISMSRLCLYPHRTLHYISRNHPFEQNTRNKFRALWKYLVIRIASVEEKR